MMIGLARLIRNRSGAAAAEMALVTPLLVILMFGSAEVGKFFWDEHLVVKAVRDGARFAARQSFASMPCGGPAANEAQIRNLVRFGKPVVTDTDQPRLSYWTDAATITVSIRCYDNAGTDGARVYDGLYSDRPQVPLVEVSASVPYAPLFGLLGISAGGLKLNAADEAAVFGL